MDERIMFTEEELRVKRDIGRTTFYQNVLYPKLQDVIIDKRYRAIRACEHLGERWSNVRRYLSTKQKEDLENLIKKYSRNGGRKLRRVSTSPPRCS